MERFQANSDDHTVLGLDTMTFMTLSESRRTPFNKPTTVSYNPQAIVAPLDKYHFQSPFNTELNDTADGIEIALLTLSFQTPLITFFDNTPPEFAAFLGSVGGLKSILFDFWSLALLVLASINQVQAYNKRQEKGAAGATAKGPTPTSKAQIVAAVAEGEE